MVAILADDIFKHIFLNVKVRIFIQISQKFAPKGPINNKSSWVHIIAFIGGDQPASHYLNQRCFILRTPIYITRA